MSATRIPRSALTFSSAGEIGVRIVGGDETVGFVPVNVVEDEQTFMWVGGIPDGTRVIVQGQDFVREGQKVEAIGSGGAHFRGEMIATQNKRQDTMSRLIDYAINHARLTIATLIFLLCAGLVAYVTIPKESEPDVKIPIIYVQLSQRGISPEDAERLLLRPVETQLKSVGNVKEMRSTAFEGGGFVLLEFDAGFDSKSALADVRAKVDQAKHDLPRTVDEPQVLEVNLSLYPVLVVGLSGDVPERTLLRIARAAKNAIEQAPGVLAAELRGARDEAVEIIIDPTLMKSYGLSLEQLGQLTQSFNTLIAAGAIEGQSGRFAVKVPSLFEKPQDILKVPVIASQTASVTLADVAQIKPTFKDATSVTRVNGRPAMTIEVSKRTGANLIETVDAVKYVVGQLQRTWPQSVHVTFTQDKSKVIRQMLGDLQNSVATGVLLVAIVILFALGFRASLFIGIAIPASFLAGVLGLQLAGLTVNIVVLFSLILAVGMLVDDAIIVSEFAERRMAEGMPPREAYALAAKRMSGPVIAATATRVAAFSPLLFWPGMVGQFMKYLPITLIATLTASLAVALFFTPTLGALLGKAAAGQRAKDPGADRGPYMRTVRLALRHPGTTLALATFLLVAVQVAYGKFGRGVEFFPNVEPDYGQVIVHGRGNLALDEKNHLLAEVEKQVLGFDGITTVYTRVGEQPRGMSELTEDTIGVIQFEFADWRTRAPARQIMDAIRAKTADIPGILVEVTAPRAGPPTGKPIQVQLSALDPALLPAAANKVTAMLAARHDVRDLDDGQPLPGIDWKIEVDKSEAAKYGAGVNTVGSAVQLVTNGLKATEYRPVDSDKSVDILVRFPPDRRSLDQIDELRVQTQAGHVPIGNFVQRVPVQRVGYINRVNSNRVMTVSANIAEGVQPAKVQQDIAAQLARADLGPGVTFKLKGEDEEREKAGAFLLKAFGTAIFLIFAILLAQFNKLTSVGLVLTAVVMSTFGVLLGLLVMGQAFGVVMTGIGVIANAGVIVNNNIVLIDTFDRLRREGKAALRRHPGDLPRARASGGAHRDDGDPRRAADRVRHECRIPGARDHGRRAGDPVVDPPFDRDRVRPRVRDRAHVDRDAGGADGDREPAREPPPMVGRAARADAGVRTLVTSAARLTRLLLRDDPRVLDHLRPFPDLGGDQLGEFVRRAGQRRDGEGVHPVLRFRPLDEIREHPVEPVENRSRRPGGRDHRKPAGRRITRQPRLGDGRQIRHRLDSLRGGDAVRLHLSVLDHRNGDCQVDHHHGDAAGDHVGERGNAAAIGNVLRLGVDPLEKHLHEKAMRRRCSRAGIAELTGPAPDERDQLGKRVGAERGIGDQRKLRGADEADRREILHRVIGQRLVDVRSDRKRRHRCDENGMAVGCGSRNRLGCDDRAGARTVVHDHRAPELVLELLRQQARENVGAATGREMGR